MCAWIGNKAAVAQEHYLQVTDADFERAAKSGAVAVQKAVQHPAAALRGDSQTNEKTPENPGFSLALAGSCDSVPYKELPPRGLEPLACFS